MLSESFHSNFGPITAEHLENLAYVDLWPQINLKSKFNQFKMLSQSFLLNVSPIEASWTSNPKLTFDLDDVKS